MKLTEIEARYSPMGFEDRAIDNDIVNSLFDAARWAASSYNEQPWHFIYALKEDTEAYLQLHSLMGEYNQNWSKNAPLLVLALSRKTLARNDKPNYFHHYDLGMAVQNLVLEGVSHGLHSHQMGGYDMKKAKELLNIPDNFSMGAMIAIGYPQDNNKVDAEFSERANLPRERKDINSITQKGAF